jgi:hypothetical protein
VTKKKATMPPDIAALVAELEDDYAREGKAALERWRDERPVDYVHVSAHLFPDAVRRTLIAYLEGDDEALELIKRFRDAH